MLHVKPYLFLLPVKDEKSKRDQKTMKNVVLQLVLALFLERCVGRVQETSGKCMIEYVIQHTACSKVYI